jgi:hypothetical protein
VVDALEFAGEMPMALAMMRLTSDGVQNWPLLLPLSVAKCRMRYS